MDDDELRRHVHVGMYHRLIDVARRGGIISYGELGKEFNLHPRTQVPDELYNISVFEHARGQPLLSAIVVNAESLLPGAGFYELGVEFGKVRAGQDYDKQEEFAVQEMKVVHKAWKSNRS